MANGVQFSQKWDAVRKRIKKIPRFAHGVADTIRKGDANKLVAYWRAGIMGNTLGLFALKPETVARKMAKGYTNPYSPLYGLGFEGAKTYIKGMRVFKTSTGYRVQMINGKHHESELSLRSLFIVHEYGTTIRRGDRIIRIPARPAMTKSYEKLMLELRRKDPSKEFKKACNEFLNTGRSSTAQAIESRSRAMEAQNRE